MYLWKINDKKTRMLPNKECCNAIGCVRCRPLIRAFRGYFCKHHLLNLKRIRKNTKKALNISQELHWRLEEICFRKFPDDGHLMRVEKLKQMTHCNSTGLEEICFRKSSDVGHLTRVEKLKQATDCNSTKVTFSKTKLLADKLRACKKRNQEKKAICSRPRV